MGHISYVRAYKSNKGIGYTLSSIFSTNQTKDKMLISFPHCTNTKKEETSSLLLPFPSLALFFFISVSPVLPNKELLNTMIVVLVKMS